MQIERVSMLHIVLHNQDDVMLRNQAKRRLQKADAPCWNKAAHCRRIDIGVGYNYMEKHPDLCKVDMR
jgi:hypothetical protein